MFDTTSKQATPVPPATMLERFSWCMYDFANSGYTTVVLTAVFNAYFVGVVAGEYQNGEATLLWTIAMAIANAVVLLCAPLLGAIADHSANKKRFLMISTCCCITFTALLSLIGPGDIATGMSLVILATIMFAAGESFIAAFLPEISTPEHMGRISGYGWTVGYLGGLLTLGLCIAYITWAQGQGHSAERFVPVTNLIVAAIFTLTTLPTFLWLRERAISHEKLSLKGYLNIGHVRLQHTFKHARQHQDLFRFLLTLTVYHSGINTVIVLAAVYAQEVMHFNTQATLQLIMVVNITAAIGALMFGHIQDRIGSRRSLIFTLIIWIIAVSIACNATDTGIFWLAANLIGFALGASQSAGRAMVGQFSPPQRSGEFFGLWGLAVRFAAIIGPLTYGAINYLLQGNHRLAILSTLIFFIAGLILLFTVNEQRGKQAALQDHWNA